MTPSLREALVERGVQITEPEKKTGKECAEAYEAWKADGGLRFSTKGKGKKIPSSQSGTGQFSTDSLSDGHVRSAHRSPTDTPGVPFDDAKVIKITSKAKNNIKKFKNGDASVDTTNVNNMLASLRRLFSMSCRGRSNYGVYDTPKGRFAFRLTEHNAFGDNFAQDNAQLNVSVYVASNEYEVPDSLIPYDEYRLRPEEFEKHRDEFVSSLVDSMDSVLNTGIFTQPAYTELVHDGLEKVNPNENVGDMQKSTVDREYMSAVEAGDMAKAEQMVKAAAKAAMPDTKVVDKDGEPLVVYHGGPFGHPIPENPNSNEPYIWDVEGAGGGWFTPIKDYAETYLRPEYRERPVEFPIAVYLNIRNPFELLYNEELIVEDGKPTTLLHEIAGRLGVDDNVILDLIDWGWAYSNDDAPAWAINRTPEFIDLIRSKGYDGVHTVEFGNDAYMTIDPEQIKSADPVTYDDNGNVIPLSERFNEGKQDIRFSTVDMSNYEVIKEAREMVSGEKQPFSGYVSSEYYRGETEDGEPYVIRVSDHPAKKDNFDLYEDNEGKVLSLVFTDDLEGDFEEWKKRFEGINDDEWEEMEQIIFDSKTIDLDKLRDGINYYKKIGKTSGLKESGEFVSLDAAGNSVRFSTVDSEYMAAVEAGDKAKGYETLSRSTKLCN